MWTSLIVVNIVHIVAVGSLQLLVLHATFPDR